MKKPWATVALAAALSLAVAAPVAAASPVIDASVDKGTSAWGDSYTCTEDVPGVGDSTCENTSAWVSDGWSRYNGERFRNDALCVSSGTSVYHAATQTYDDFWTSCLGQIDCLSTVMSRKYAVAGSVQRRFQVHQEFYIIIDHEYAGRHHS